MNSREKCWIDLDSVGFIGSNLQRPEATCIDKKGNLHVADWRGGVTLISPEGRQQFIRAADDSVDIKPNGIFYEPSGSWLLAHLGDDSGGVYRLFSDGGLEPILLEIDGLPLPPTNFAEVDVKGRIWITVSTRVQPRQDDYRADANSGFVVLIDRQGARIVADQLGYANECMVDPSGRYLYVNETFKRQLTRFDIAGSGDLNRKTLITEFGHGTFPDGLAMDTEGMLWVVSIVSNRIIRVSPSGEQHVILEDADPQHVEWVEHAFQEQRMNKEHLAAVSSRYLKNVSSISFGGEDDKTIYLGCLLGQSIATFRSPVAGIPR